MVVTDAGMVMLVRAAVKPVETPLSQLPNASPPIVVREGGRAMVVRLVQPQNAILPIDVTEEGLANVTFFSATN